MELTVRDAAALLGKSPRTVRNMAQQGTIPAKRVGGRWLIDGDGLEAAADARRDQTERIRERLNSALDRTAPPAADGQPRGFYSVRDLQIYQVALSLVGELAVVVREHAPAGEALATAQESLKEFVRLLTDGCHQFQADLKVDRFVRARSCACRALADLLLFQRLYKEPDLSTVIDRLEREVLGSLRGLLRRAESQRS